MTKVIDSFLFTHEFDLLELRLRTLWTVVDKFILMEGDHNFSNTPKEMRFEEQEKRFEWAAEKLVVVQHIGKFKDYEGEITVPGELFVEHQHRQCLYDNVKEMDFDPDDILLVSDIDEIPSREVIELLKGKNVFRKDTTQPILLHQDFYYYNIKCHRGKRWNGTMAMRFDYELGDVGTARALRNQMRFIDSNCGWHLAHFYDSDGIREKLKHSSHRGYDAPEFHNPEHLKKCVQNNWNYLGKEDGTFLPEPLPEYLLAELKRFPLMMGEEWR